MITFKFTDYLTEDDIPDYKLQEHNRIQKHIPEEIPFSDNVSIFSRNDLTSSIRSEIIEVKAVIFPSLIIKTQTLNYLRLLQHIRLCAVEHHIHEY